MNVHPFIEAEEVAGHSVKTACRLLEVSRAAYYERKSAVPSARELSDRELIDKITAVHTESKGTYGSPRVHQELVKRGVACGRRRVRRLMRRAGLEGRCKKRWRKTTVPDPAAERVKDASATRRSRTGTSCIARVAGTPSEPPGAPGGFPSSTSANWRRSRPSW